MDLKKETFKKIRIKRETKEKKVSQKGCVDAYFHGGKFVIKSYMKDHWLV